MKKRGLRYSEEEIVYAVHCCLQGVLEARGRGLPAHGFITPHTIAAAPGAYKLGNRQLMGSGHEDGDFAGGALRVTLYETLLNAPNEGLCYLAPELLEALARRAPAPYQWHR